MMNNPFCRGMAAGLLVGTGIALAIKPKHSKTCKCMKHTTGKILKNAGNVIDTIQGMF